MGMEWNGEESKNTEEYFEAVPVPDTPLYLFCWFKFRKLNLLIDYSACGMAWLKL